MILTDVEALELFGEHGNYPGQLVWAVEKAILQRLANGFWVCVQDSLPDAGKTVWAALSGGDVRQLQYRGEAGWLDDGGGVVPDVTHWAPVPTNPNVGLSKAG